MNDKDLEVFFGGIAVGILTGILLFLAIGSGIGGFYRHGIEEMREECVKRGYGNWDYGQNFVWKGGVEVDE